MSTLITTGAETITPTQILGYADASEGGNIIHPILGRAEPDVTLRPGGLRSGTLTLGFQGATSESDSAVARALLNSGVVFNIVSTDRGTIEMAFVRSGQVGRELEDNTRDAWTVTVDFHEVAP
jgi:hypothetical protein